jgi:uncharacterized caspase-like protein
MTAPAHAERRVALVIGNNAYQNVNALKNPVNDANLIAAALKKDGFDVKVANDLGHDDLVKALRNFRGQADGADWAVVYYAGHGIEMGGENYLIPVDARLAEDRDVEDEAVSLDRVMAIVEGSRQVKMIILDACRNNPFLATMKQTTEAHRDVGRGLAVVDRAGASLVAFSAKAGTISLDGDGVDSPFATALAQHLTEPGVEVDKLFRLVRDDVLDATGNKQEPFVYGSLPGRHDFYFAATPDTGVDPAALASRKDVAAAPGAVPQGSAEIEFWESIKSSSKKQELEAYLQQFPAGTFAPLARARIAELEAASEKAEAASEPAPLPPDEVAWQRIASLTDAGDFDSFVRMFPGSPHAAEAKAKADSLRPQPAPPPPPPGELAWKRIAASNDPADFDSFARMFPDSAHKADADAKAASLRPKTPPGKPAQDAATGIGKDAPAATKELAALEKGKAEEEIYQKARGNAGLLRSYTKNCEVCAHQKDADLEASRLELDAKFFMLKVCNKSTRRASVAVMGLTAPDNSDWHIQGWWTVPAGQCTSLRKYVKGTIYVFAQEYGNSSFAWKGSGPKLCVDFPGPFDRVDQAGYNCRPSEKPASFSSFSVADDTFTWDLNRQ